MVEPKPIEKGLAGMPGEVRRVADRVASGQSVTSFWSIGFLATVAGAFMINIDTSVVGVVLPAISRHFNLPVTAAQWLASAYLLAVTAIIPVVSRLAERVDRRQVFAAGYLAFAVGTGLVGVVPWFSGMVAARVLQGAGAAAMMTNVTAVAALLFPVGMRGRALGYTAAAVAAGTLIGPGLGGWVAQVWGWRMAFWINVPVALAAWAGVSRYLPAFATQQRTAFDGWGALWFALAAGALEAGLAFMPRPVGLLLLILAGIFAGALVRCEKRAAAPMIPLRLLASRRVARVLLAGLAYYVVQMFPAFLMPLYLRQIRDLPLAVVGLLMMLQATAMVVSAPVGGWTVDRFGAALPARLGLGLLAAGGGLFFSLGPTSPLATAAVGLGLAGIGAGFFNAAGQTMLLNAVPPADLGVASGFAALQRAMGRALGVAMATLALALTWVADGIGTTLPLGHPHYRHWLLSGLHGSFAVQAAVALAGLLTIPGLHPRQGAKVTGGLRAMPPGAV